MQRDEERRRPMRTVVPSRNDPVLKKFTELAGGPMGRRSSPGRIDPGFFTVERVLIIFTTVAALLSILVKTPCRVGGWANPDQQYMTCYSDWPELFLNRGLAQGVLPFITEGARFEYPVLLGLLAGFTALLAPPADAMGIVSHESMRQYFDINATLVAAVWIVTVIATLRMTNRRPWDAAMVALAPGIILAGTINWDMWAVMLATLGMLAFARNHLVTAGILIGLGTALKIYPVLIFGAILVLAIRTLKIREAAVTAAAIAGTWLAVNLPVMLHNFESWRYFFDFSSDRGAGYSSVWYAFNIMSERAGGTALDPAFINTAALYLFIAACAAIAVLALTAPRRPRLVQLALLIVGAFILTNKVYSPQFVVWLIPLVALAYPKWRAFLVWQFFEVMHWWAVWMYLGKVASGGAAQHNIDTPYYVLAVLGHMLATAYVMYGVVLSILDPRLDPVRRLDIDDPQGGPFDGALDRVVFDRRLLARVRLARTAYPAKEPT